ncbi:hypothetical protein L484_006468 [Morus notabilis]|uniref:Uncharacterized protein n=1 Tax=Morus notabilis TaxID=981085 RepID=W9SR93_9ROSA|nr:hypothetical protein L484_006468 [Morus notabilis]
MASQSYLTASLHYMSVLGNGLARKFLLSSITSQPRNLGLFISYNSNLRVDLRNQKSSLGKGGGDTGTDLKATQTTKAVTDRTTAIL